MDTPKLSTLSPVLKVYGKALTGTSVTLSLPSRPLMRTYTSASVLTSALMVYSVPGLISFEKEAFQSMVKLFTSVVWNIPFSTKAGLASDIVQPNPAVAGSAIAKSPLTIRLSPTSGS